MFRVIYLDYGELFWYDTLADWTGPAMENAIAWGVNPTTIIKVLPVYTCLRRI